MNRMTFLGASLLVVAFAAVQGCGGDDTGTGGAGGAGAAGPSSTTGTGASGGTGGTGGGPMFPKAPALGTQVDRFGRPAINTAANHTFDPDTAAKGAAKDAYNADAADAMWVTKYTPEVATNLAIIDSLDTNCGNQLLAGPDPVAGRYNGLGGALANDKLFVNTGATLSTTYLAVEATAALGLPLGGDGGGRRLEFDVIDISYSALAVGALAGVSDGIPADADTAGTTFPYLAVAH